MNAFGRTTTAILVLSCDLSALVLSKTIEYPRLGMGRFPDSLCASAKKVFFIMLFEKNKQHIWYGCCQISLVISNIKFNRKLSEQFWRI